MKKKYLFFLFGILFLSFFIIFYRNYSPVAQQIQESKQSPAAKKIESQVNENNLAVPGQNKSDEFKMPLEKTSERVTKKEFGKYVTPENSPVSPERFSGYHTGVDFEIFPGEENVEIKVSAMCSGKLLEKRYASGYGGALVQSCRLNNEDVTVIYGHLELASIDKKIGDDLNAGDLLGILGDGNSQETDGERKHLHLGIHKGKDINLLGYAKNQTQLSQWHDPCKWVCD